MYHLPEKVRSFYAKDADKVAFCKVKKPISEENFAELKDNFIPDSDLPNLEGKLKLLPLSITDYPKVLSSMTANQAGYWALMKCKEENWHILD